MNAVNLAPTGSNKRHRGGPSSTPKVSLSPQSIALLGCLVVVLVGTFLYASAHNRVSSRRAQLAQIQGGVAQWSAAAAGFDGQVAQYEKRASALASVRQLIAERYHWSLLLSQIAGVTPKDVQLTSLQASSPAAAADGTSTTGTNGVAVAGCATSHSAVAAAMVALRRVTGIAAVTLSSSTQTGVTSGAASGSGDSGAATTNSGSCALPVSFQLTLVFGASSGDAPAATSTDPSTGVVQ